MILSAVVAFALFLLATLAPFQMGQWFGSIGILLSAALALLPTLTWLTSSPKVSRWHWLTLLLAWATVWSYFDLNDNHHLRQLPQRPPPATPPDFNAAFRAWLQARPAKAGQEAYPVVLVAAEGGGIRAAYFSAQVLAAIQDQCPAFASHLFAISGVSGGSVGSAAFAGILDGTKPIPASEAPCDMSPRAQLTVGAKVESILRTDYLAPVAATLLYPDALQRLLPFPVGPWDRARTLERTVEKSFSSVVPTDFMERSIFGYWRPDGNVNWPPKNGRHEVCYF
jgi:hypothetical protein